jgi:predicted type IV restriction endonuclease
MSKEHVRQAVSKAQKLIEESYCEPLWQNEIRTRYVLIDPLLSACGWDLSNPNQVTIEARTEKASKKRVDYRLALRDGTPIYVEAKVFTHQGLKWGSDRWKEDKEPLIRQLRSYVSNKRIGFAVITDGDLWIIYDLSRKGRRFSHKLAERISLCDDSLNRCTDVLHKWLRRDYRHT